VEWNLLLVPLMIRAHSLAFVLGCVAATACSVDDGGADRAPASASNAPNASNDDSPPAPGPAAPAGGDAAPVRPLRTGPPAPKLVTLLQGQSNAVFLQDGAGYWGVYATLVKELTGIPEHDAQAVRSDFSDPEKGYTLASGTPTYSFTTDSEQLWLDAKAPGAKLEDPSTWPTGTHGTALQHHVESAIKGHAPDGVPVVVLRFHSEYDSTKTGAEAAVYAAANRRFVSLLRTWIGKPAAEVPVFLGMPAFVMNTKDEALTAIRDAWRTDIANATLGCHWMFGSAYDTTDRGDLSHMDEAGDKVVGGRAALAVSRWLYDNGYSHRDLSWLPRLGPRIVQVKRVPGASDALDAVIQHDKGTDLVVPPNVELGVISVDDDGVSRDAVAITRVDATTLRIHLASALGPTDGKIRFDYTRWPAYNGAGRLVTDNWRTGVAKPGWAAAIADLGEIELPVRRLDQPLVVGAPPVSDPPAP
jgi:hypothetical protein